MEKIGQIFNLKGASISAAEFSQLESVKNDQKLMSIFNALAGGDGKLDEKELVKAFGAYFEYDKNNDHVLSDDESDKFKQSLGKNGNIIDQSKLNDFFKAIAVKFAPSADSVKKAYMFFENGTAFTDINLDKHELGKMIARDGHEISYYTKGKNAGRVKSGVNSEGVSYRYKYHKDDSYTVRFNDGSTVTYDKDNQELGRTFPNGASYKVTLNEQGELVQVWENTQPGIPYVIHSEYSKKPVVLYDMGESLVELTDENAKYFVGGDSSSKCKPLDGSKEVYAVDNKNVYETKNPLKNKKY